MSVTRRAVIDVGTNSVKLLVADVRGREVIPQLETSAQTRLGEGFYDQHHLQPAAVARTAQVIERFARQAGELKSESIRIIATSAVRDAVNQAEFVQKIEALTGLKVEIISGELEAHWAFVGAASGCGSTDRPLLILDVGGGSTEFILGHGEERVLQQSFPLGTVRMLEQFRHSDPPTEAEWRECERWLKSFFVHQVRPALAPALNLFPTGSVQLIGTGGTTTILARMKLRTLDYERARIEALELTREEVFRQRAHLWSLPLSARKQITGLPPDRADVILMGVALFAVLVEEFGFAKIGVSTRGLRFAALMDPVKDRGN